MKNDECAADELRALQAAWRTLERRWNLCPVEARRLLPAAGEDREHPPLDTETRMRILIEIGYRVEFDVPLLRDWLRTSSATLRWLTPLDAMSGTIADLRGVRRLVEAGFAS